MTAGNVWPEQDRFGKKVALNTKIVPVDNDSFVDTNFCKVPTRTITLF